MIIRMLMCQRNQPGSKASGPRKHGCLCSSELSIMWATHVVLSYRPMGKALIGCGWLGTLDLLLNLLMCLHQGWQEAQCKPFILPPSRGSTTSPLQIPSATLQLIPLMKKVKEDKHTCAPILLCTLQQLMASCADGQALECPLISL